MLDKIKNLYRTYFPYRKKMVYEIGPKGEFIHMENMPESYFMDLDKNLFSIIIQSLEQYKKMIDRENGFGFGGNKGFHVPFDDLNDIDKNIEKKLITNISEEIYSGYYKPYPDYKEYMQYEKQCVEVSNRRTKYLINDMIYYFKHFDIKSIEEYNAFKGPEEDLKINYNLHKNVYLNGQITFTNKINYFWA